MTPISLPDLADVVGGQLLRADRRVVDRISTDTRTLGAGDLFVALRGERFDAHDHLPAAAQAAAAVVERVPEHVPTDLPLILVPDARRALGDLASWHRDKLRGRVIAVGGSNGKTGTKLLIDGVLRTRLQGTASPRSFNNDVGVPMTLLAADARDDYVIVECGTNHPGEIARLREIARPDVAVVTSIGREHLEALVDLDGVRRENLELLRGTPVSIVCSRDGQFLQMAYGLWGDVRSYDVPAADVDADLLGTDFAFAGREWRVPHLGRHAATNSAAAILVGRSFGLDDATIAAGLMSAEAPPMRLAARQLPGGATLLDDCYNANPDSVEAALAFVADLDVAGRRIGVLGDMLELGPEAPRLHRAALERARQTCDIVLTVGPQMRAAGSVANFATAAEAVETLLSVVFAGDVVLLKASRGTRLDVIADALCDQAPAATALAA